MFPGGEITGPGDGRGIADVITTEARLCPKEVYIVIPAYVLHVRDCLIEGQERRWIQNAVEVCTKVGGGTVIVGDGEWVSGFIHLHGNNSP